jgi:hypothetical protein
LALNAFGHLSAFCMQLIQFQVGEILYVNHLVSRFGGGADQFV